MEWMSEEERAYAAALVAVYESKTQEQRLQEVQKLPTLDSSLLQPVGQVNSEAWTVSYSEVIPGVWRIDIEVLHVGSSSHGSMVVGELPLYVSQFPPPADYMIAALCSAMTDPSNHSNILWHPHRPLKLLVTYRLFHAFEAIESAMNTCGITCELETKAEARKNAETKGTHYLGLDAEEYKRNPVLLRRPTLFEIRDRTIGVESNTGVEQNKQAARQSTQDWDTDTCDTCGTTNNNMSWCSACKCRKFCGKSCQRRDWNKSHRPQCPILQDLKTLPIAKDRTFYIGFTKDEAASHRALWVMVANGWARSVPLSFIRIEGQSPTWEEMFQCFTKSLMDPDVDVSKSHGSCRPFAVAICDSVDMDLARKTATVLCRLGIEVVEVGIDSKSHDTCYRAHQNLESIDDSRVTGTVTIPFQYTWRKEVVSHTESPLEVLPITFESITAMPEYERSGKSFEELHYEDYLNGNRGSKGGSCGTSVPFLPTTRSSESSLITFQSITAMPEYEQGGKSFEELRFEDYLQGNRGSQDVIWSEEALGSIRSTMARLSVANGTSSPTEPPRSPSNNMCKRQRYRKSAR